MTTFIGVDLAWRSSGNHTGMAALAGDRNGAELVAIGDPAYGIDDVIVFIRAYASVNTVIAIDAPLIIENMVGQRPCETAIGVRYGARDASCHTSNLRLYPEAGSVALGKRLISDGFAHAATGTRCERVILEVYPHAAMVALFDLPQVLKYKKGSVIQKRAGLDSLASHLRRLAHAAPALKPNDALVSLLLRDVNSVKGAELKRHEDRLDAVFCAYLAYYFWFWGMQRNEIFGTVDRGYILNPILVPGGVDG